MWVWKYTIIDSESGEVICRKGNYATGKEEDRLFIQVLGGRLVTGLPEGQDSLTMHI